MFVTAVGSRARADFIPLSAAGNVKAIPQKASGVLERDCGSALSISRKPEARSTHTQTAIPKQNNIPIPSIDRVRVRGSWLLHPAGNRRRKTGPFDLAVLQFPRRQSD